MNLELLSLLFLGSVAGLVGGFLFLLNKKLARVFTRYAIPLAAGVLLATSFLDLLPHAFEEIGENAFVVVLASFVTLFLIEHFLIHLHHHDEDSKSHHSHIHTSVPLVIIGDTIHNFLDGVAIAAAYLVNPSLGLIVALATFLHETPHEVADFGILLSSGWSKKRAIVANFLSALATFPGAAIAIIAHETVESMTGVLIAVAAGLFMYVATTDFLPQVGKSSKEFSWSKFIVMVGGILLIVILGSLVPEIGH